MTEGQRIALDTNAAILLNKGHWLTAQVLAGYDEWLLPAPVMGELLFGAYNSGRPELNLRRERSFIAGFGLLLIDAEAAEQYAIIRHELKKQGQPIPENDMWIAAVCLANSLPLFTSDRHFNRVAGLQTVAA